MKTFLPKDVVELIFQYCNNIMIQKLYQTSKEIYSFINQSVENDKLKSDLLNFLNK